MIRYVRNLSIKNKLLLTVLLPGISSLAIAGVLLLALELGEFRQNVKDDLSALATIIGNRSSAALIFLDTELANENLGVFNMQPIVQTACLYDAKGALFTQFLKTRTAWPCPVTIEKEKTHFESNELYVIEQIVDQTDLLGSVLIYADFKDAYWRKLQFIGLLFLVLATVAIITFFLSIPFISLIASPISKLVDVVKMVSKTKDYSLKATKENNDEVGVLVDAFNDLLITVKTQNKTLTRAKDRYVALFDDNPTMVFNLSDAGIILSVNMTGAKHLGLAIDDLQDYPIFDFIHPNDLPIIHALMADCRTNPQIAHKQEIRQICQNGRIIWVRAVGRSVKNEARKNSLLLVCEDVTETHQLTEQIIYQTNHDALTGLANRSAFDLTVKEAVVLAHTEGSEHALCYLDLDQFKIVNDTCGHLAGDELLRQLADLLKKHIRRHDFIARLGGDEFGILMYNCTQHDALLACEEIRDIIKDFRFDWDGKQFSIGASIGIASINDVSGNAINLLKEADAACYAAKDNGRNRVHVFRPDDEELAVRHGEMQWATKINQGLEQNSFCLYGQPIIAMNRHNEGLHFETLVRYQDSQGAIIPPGAFLPSAERYNLAPAMDRWVISHLFEWLANNPSFLNRLMLCSVNLSGLSLSDENMKPFIAEQFRQWAIPPDKICFEITETAVIANLSYATKFINHLRDNGCLFSLDDFGSGLSSFAYLKNLPVDFLKIDGQFVKGILDDKIDLAMVKAINEVGHIMGKKTIAEFVENEKIFSLLNELGIDYAQGYYISKPVALDELKLIIPS